MDSTYSWHPGALRVNPNWALPIPLQPDELFSSWLIRAALEHGCDPLSFTGAIWPRWRVWTVDLDRQLPPERIATLAHISGLNSEQLVLASLTPIAQQIQGKVPHKKTLWSWLLALGSRNRNRSGGLQYCPICFAEDRTPYYRLQWRFAWHVCCEKHGTKLLDHCPNCLSMLEPHQLVAEAGTLNQCATCGESLSKTTSSTITQHASALQFATDQVLQTNQANLFGYSATPSEWFAVMRIWMDLFRRGWRAQTAGTEQLAKAFCPSLLSPDSSMFETLRINQRILLLNPIGWLMSLTLDELIALFKASNLSSQSVFLNGIPNIEAMRRLADALPSRPKQNKGKILRKFTPSDLPAPRSRRRVEALMRKLQQKMATSL